jgi:hypothetical protein
MLSIRYKEINKLINNTSGIQALRYWPYLETILYTTVNPTAVKTITCHSGEVHLVLYEEIVFNNKGKNIYIPVECEIKKQWTLNRDEILYLYSALFYKSSKEKLGNG